MSQLTPLVSAHHGAFFIKESIDGASGLTLASSYGYRERKSVPNRFRFGEGLIGQCAREKKTISSATSRLTTSRSTPASANPAAHLIILPVVFEGELKAGAIELASFQQFSDIHQLFLDQLTESLRSPST